MRRLTTRDYRRMPWRNGGGVTTELVIGPEASNAATGGFHYRASIADVATDGPFSRFEGCDRHIMLLEGRGMTLDCGAHGVFALEAPLVPHLFSGDWDVHGALVDGPVRDFNLIVDRARARSSLAVRTLDGPERLLVPGGSLCIVHVLSGALEGGGTGDTLVVDATCDLVPRGSATLAIADIRPR